MPDDLYERDFLVWSERQAALLRRLAAGARVGEDPDWPHLIEEVEDLGRAELHACESLLGQAMLHLIKLHAGAVEPAAHWRAEIVAFLADAARRFTPGMRQRIDLDGLWRATLRQARAADIAGVGTLPRHCPWTLDALIGEETEIEALLAGLRQA